MSSPSLHKAFFYKWIPFILPIIFFLVAIWARQMHGPYWLNTNLDPTYGYLLSSLNILNNISPTHIDHPGTTVQFLGALIFRFMHLGSQVEEIIENVLRDPEYYLRVVNSVIILIHALLILIIGLFARSIFKNSITPTILQLSPFFSHLIIRHGSHFKPEALLITASLLTILLTLYVLKSGKVSKNSNKIIFCYGAIGSFGVATKVTFLPLLVLPIFLFTRKIDFFFYGLVIFLSFLFFTMPISDVYDRFFEYMEILFWGSDYYGSGFKTVINLSTYSGNIYELLSRPMLIIPITLSLFTLYKFNFLFSTLKRNLSSHNKDIYLRVLKGVVLGQLLSILLIAKHPSSLYLIPVLMLSSIAIVINFQLWFQFGDNFLREKIIKTTVGLICFGIMLQIASIYQNVRDYYSYHQETTKISESEFNQCARIYFQWASSQSFALYWGNNLAGQTFNKELKEIIPKNDFWFSVHEVRKDEVRDFLLRLAKPGLRNMGGPIDDMSILKGYPCLYFRGTDKGQFYKFLPQLLVDKNMNSTCSRLQEHILTDLKTCKE